MGRLRVPILRFAVCFDAIRGAVPVTILYHNSRFFLIFASVMKRLAVIVLVLFQCFVAGAQYFPAKEGDGALLKGVKKTLNFLTRPKKYIDSTYLWAAPPELRVRTSNSLQRTGMVLDWDFKSDGYKPESLKSDYLGGLKNKVGFKVSYAKISLGLSFEVDKNKKWHKRNASFGYKSGPWVISADYLKIKDVLSDDMPDTYCVSKHYTLDVFYGFNRRRFAYDAAFGRSIVQRRSAGSFMLAARLLHGKSTFDKNDYLMSLIGNVSGYSSYQGLLGVGYSYNLVFWHKDPQPVTYRAWNSNARQGLRNFTLSVTLIPFLTAYSYVMTVPFSSEEGGASSSRVRTITNKPQLNYIGRASLGFNFNRFSFGLRFIYDRSLFNFIHSPKNDNEDLYDIHWKGHLSIKTFSTYIILYL